MKFAQKYSAKIDMSIHLVNRVMNSARWAAYGDALGFITELGDESTVKWRSGECSVSTLSQWRRKIGGIYGLVVDFPAGTYSDDTQLRIATGRAIRPDGYFDVESFAKIELPVFLSYALGAGRGTKAAAHNLTKKNVNWFSNFFETKGANYFNGGGNGAAMRIQPHVWSNVQTPDSNRLIVDVIKNSITTHGHPRGFLGAVFHALCLEWSFIANEIPEPRYWLEIADKILVVPDLLRGDNELGAFWLPIWEERCSRTIDQAVDDFLSELAAAIETIIPVIDSNATDRTAVYANIVSALDARADENRGSGLLTSLIALASAWYLKSEPLEKSLAIIANDLNSDTDTIATMSGALLGAVSDFVPSQSVQDQDYIEIQARGLVERDKNVEFFTYPDVAFWQPPKSQSSCLVKVGDGLAIVGIGSVKALSAPLVATSRSKQQWQWVGTPFGQTLLVKRQEAASVLKGASLSNKLGEYQKAKEQGTVNKKGEVDSGAARVDSKRGIEQPSLNFREEADLGVQNSKSSIDLDKLSLEAIKSGFDSRLIGGHLLLIADMTGSIELVVAYSAILAKARISRNKHNRS